MWHASGMDLAPYTRLYERMRDRILGYETHSDPAPGTFADGVANQAAVDAIRASSAQGSWTAVAT
jgi:predicted dehydrogenase